MRLENEYKRQNRWRAWTVILDALPSLEGKTVLDLGCAVGDQAALLAERGAHVIGIDENAELLAVARRRKVPQAEFHQGDVRSPSLGSRVDAIWSSFTAAYLLDLPDVLAGWRRLLRPHGWIALTEVEDLFGHRPLGAKSTRLLARYTEDAIEQRRYDFHMGGKLAEHLRRAGFAISTELAVLDRELSFDGPAEAEVVDAWRQRFDRMKLLQAFCGEEFVELRDEFLACLRHPDHRSTARVRCVVGRRQK